MVYGPMVFLQLFIPIFTHLWYTDPWYFYSCLFPFLRTYGIRTHGIFTVVYSHFYAPMVYGPMVFLHLFIPIFTHLWYTDPWYFYNCLFPFLRTYGIRTHGIFTIVYSH